ncbi:MAG: hypothetical protein FD149_2551 [Rhodospirillaceae bacterium]|nr:MAG: hypothetical protein FD149_2551 [Rhodospirillaceae bacterium]
MRTAKLPLWYSKAAPSVLRAASSRADIGRGQTALFIGLVGRFRALLCVVFVLLDFLSVIRCADPFFAPFTFFVFVFVFFLAVQAPLQDSLLLLHLFIECGEEIVLLVFLKGDGCLVPTVWRLVVFRCGLFHFLMEGVGPVPFGGGLRRFHGVAGIDGLSAAVGVTPVPCTPW